LCDLYLHPDDSASSAASHSVSRSACGSFSRCIVVWSTADFRSFRVGAFGTGEGTIAVRSMLLFFRAASLSELFGRGILGARLGESVGLVRLRCIDSCRRDKVSGWNWDLCWYVKSDKANGELQHTQSCYQFYITYLFLSQASTFSTASESTATISWSLVLNWVLGEFVVEALTRLASLELLLRFGMRDSAARFRITGREWYKQSKEKEGLIMKKVKRKGKQGTSKIIFLPFFFRSELQFDLGFSLWYQVIRW
jgi:hypothetical protein